MNGNLQTPFAVLFDTKWLNFIFRRLNLTPKHANIKLGHGWVCRGGQVGVFYKPQGYNMVLVKQGLHTLLINQHT